jgi:hypothetical protein
LEGVIEDILFTLHILAPDVMSLSHNPSVGIGILYLAIKFQMLNRYRAVKWLTVIQHPILEFDRYIDYKYVLIISEPEFTNLVSPVPFYLRVEKLSKVRKSEIM